MRRAIGAAVGWSKVSGFILIGTLLTHPAAAQVGIWTSHLSTNGNVSLATDPGLPGVVYTSVARSLDSGKTWEAYDLNPPANGVGAGPAGTVYAGTGIDAGGILYKSGDLGRSWSSMRLSDAFDSTGLIAVDPVSPDTVYAASIHAPAGVGSLFHPYGELRKSIDGGQTWTSLDQGDPLGLGQGSVSALALDPVTSGTLYVSTPGGNFKSTDGGVNWAPLPPLPGGPGDRLKAWVVDPFEPARMYGISPSGQLLESADGGNRFVSLPGVPNSTFAAIVPDPVRPNRIYAAITSIFPVGGSLVGGVVLSDDGGTTWQAISNGFPADFAFSLAVDARGQFLHASTFSAVYDYEIGPYAGALFLNSAHPFTVTLSATDQRTGRIGAGVATAVNDLWGWFSIPAITGNSSNPEVFVKLLDGTAINGDYWFFYGGLTDLEYTLTVKDSTTGAQKTYTKPAGSECGGSDTAAFAP